MNETLDQMIDRWDIETPGYRAEVDRIRATNAQKAIDDAQTMLESWQTIARANTYSRAPSLFGGDV